MTIGLGFDNNNPYFRSVLNSNFLLIVDEWGGNEAQSWYSDGGFSSTQGTYCSMCSVFGLIKRGFIDNLRSSVLSYLHWGCYLEAKDVSHMPEKAHEEELPQGLLSKSPRDMPFLSFWERRSALAQSLHGLFRVVWRTCCTRTGFALLPVLIKRLQLCCKAVQFSPFFITGWGKDGWLGV